MKLSVIVPVYNVQKYLSRCVESLINQSFEYQYELIFVNDASTDDSISILNAYRDKYPKKIKVIDSPINLKQGGARNLGIELATGEYIGFVDSDDWVSNNMYAMLYSEAKKGDYDVVDCDYCRAFNQNEIINYEISNHDNQIGNLNIDKKKSLILHTGRLWTKIFKRELFENNNLRFVENLFYEDNEIMPALLLHAKSLGKVKENLYYYFVDNNASTTKKSNSYHHFDRLETSIKMVNRLKSMNVYKEYREEIEYRFIELYYINTIPICLAKFDKPEIEYLKKIRSYMDEKFPEYRKNKYFKNKTKFVNKFISKTNDLSPYFLTQIFIVYKKIFMLKR